MKRTLTIEKEASLPPAKMIREGNSAPSCCCASADRPPIQTRPRPANTRTRFRGATLRAKTNRRTHHSRGRHPGAARRSAVFAPPRLMAGDREPAPPRHVWVNRPQLSSAFIAGSSHHECPSTMKAAPGSEG